MPIFDNDYPIMRGPREIEQFFARAGAFVTALPSHTNVTLIGRSDRVRSFDDRVEMAGSYAAAQEYLADLDRVAFGSEGERFHLVVMPNGWVALCCHFDRAIVRNAKVQPRLEIGIADYEPDEGANGAVLNAVAEILFGQQALTGEDPLGNQRSGSRRGNELPKCLPRADLKAALGKLDGKTVELERTSVVDATLQWFAARMPGLGEGPRVVRRAATRRPSALAPVDLANHVVNLRMGALSSGGAIRTSASDVKRIVGKAVGAGMPIAIYAHGGLTGERAAVEQARITTPWWLANGVYPIFVVWESDLASTLVDLIGAAVGVGAWGARDTLSELRDSAVERLVHATATDIWGTMKAAARLASAAGDAHGLTLLAKMFGDARADTRQPLHLVGHSAGAILHLHFLQRLEAEGIKTASVQLLAPAATTQLLRTTLAALAASPKLRIYTMTDTAERDDTVRDVYGKSLLYLVSRGFERSFGEPLCGLHKDLADDPDLLDLLEAPFDDLREALVLSPTQPGTSRRLSSHATTHGDFDNDPATMSSVVQMICDPSNDPGDDLEPFPAAARRLSDRAGATDRMPEELSTLLAAVREASAPPPPSARATVPAQARGAAIRLLSIGIDDYAGSIRLHGCVNDSNEWVAAITKERPSVQVIQKVAADALRRADIETYLTDFIASARPQDKLIWHYSGHGAPVFDTSGDEGEREQDQAILGNDTDRATAILRDDRIGDILSALDPDASLLVLLDSCFSGTATKLSPLASFGSSRVRSVGPVTIAGPRRNRAKRHLVSPGGRSVGYENANHVLVSACDFFGTAHENGPEPLGVFTRAALSVIARGTQLSNAQFCAEVTRLTRGQDQICTLSCRSSAESESFLLLS
ncbi:caspase family protein [Acuticoccus mangrovi]|uniref:Caspase family protein n=1 Tax=Acuticoccus mangrovi TaxID=2796142 RepID=A0A934IR39_9HYPH|nr:caspase family protein [Acuticoccus mangrovi]MBJ3777125.1 caspase family protein [Acuticoccus mangrovi]